MAAIKCPNCDFQLGAKELAEGWCEACGKQIPLYARSQVQETGTRESSYKQSWGTRCRARLLRFIDGRSQFVLLLTAGGLFYWGYQEHHVAEGTTTEPVDVELAALEDGTALP